MESEGPAWSSAQGPPGPQSLSNTSKPVTRSRPCPSFGRKATYPTRKGGKGFLNSSKKGSVVWEQQPRLSVWQTGFKSWFCRSPALTSSNQC